MATILVVDDVAADRAFLVTILRHQGHDLMEAADGVEGLAAVRARRPDLVITDMLMPAMNGYEFARQLDLDAATSGIPVLFYTAPFGEREARELARTSGVPYVITKPADPASVLDIVTRVLSVGLPRARDTDDSPVMQEFDRAHLRLTSDASPEEAADLRSSNAQLRALINIGLELASEPDPHHLLHRVCVAARDLFGATHVTLGILHQPDRTTVDQFLVCAATETCGVSAPPWTKPGDPVARVFHTVISERRTVRGDNPGGAPAALGLPPEHPAMFTYLIAPLASPSLVYGWICLISNENRHFTKNDEELVGALAAQVGRIYDNLSLTSAAHKRADELQHEIHERQRAESDVRHERDRAQRYLDTAEIMLVALDADGRITLTNRYACDVLGWTADELRGRSWIDVCLPKRIRAELTQSFHSLVDGSLPVAENAVLTKSGQERLIEWRNTLLRNDAGVVIGTFSSGADITERRVLEAQYQQAQKMEAVGRLAGGVAHDFNNLLTVILGFCELLLNDAGLEGRRRRDITEIQTAGTRAAGLTRQLLAFSRKQIIEPRLLNLGDVVSSMRTMFEPLIGEDVEVVMNIGPASSLVKADRGQLEQVIMNLAVNARDAMPRGGRLTIAVTDGDVDRHGDAGRAATCVLLTMTDTGMGMTEQVKAHLFEPFFTTKAPGKGTGLGLATVQGIMARSGGRVEVESVIGSGTSFKLYFPKADGVEATVRVARPVTRPPGGQTVLVVDDAEGVRELAKRLLERLGYTVLVAANANAALAVFEQDPSINVLLTDVVMPGASGPELTKQLVERKPALVVIYMSGYTEEAIAHHGVLNPGIAFLQKPFTSDTLDQKIREVTT